MADLDHGGSRPATLDLLTAWMGNQRWYAAKGSAPVLSELDAWRLRDPAGEVGIETLIVLDDGEPLHPVAYQVPLTYREAPVEGLEHALVGTLEPGGLGRRWVYDGTHDPVYAAQLLALVRGLVRARSSSAPGALGDDPVGEPAPSWRDDLTFVTSRVLDGEQSNTSIIIDALGPDDTPRPVIVKVFRMLSPGENPDVVLQSALREAGCERVPAVVGSVRGRWDPTAYAPAGGATPGGDACVHLAFAQEFLPGVEDAWRVATRAVEEGTDFGPAATALGRATAEVHTALAEAIGTTPTTTDTVDAVIAGMADRYARAVTEVPELARLADLVRQVHEDAAAADWPPAQRIHGDYHLGQVLHSPDRGWILLDFEGEPLRPLAERTGPDQWMRDIAGMLRSFDYAGGSWEHDHGGSARAWVRAAQAAFLDGYAAGSGTDPRDHRALLTAFEVDKAMYEVVYEARNRPDWVTIPLAAIDRLTAGVREGAATKETT